MTTESGFRFRNLFLSGINTNVGFVVDNKLGKELMPFKILSKFGDNQMKNVEVREWTKVHCLILTNSRTITQIFLVPFGWSSNLANSYTYKHAVPVR